ncbi:uncharacterized protein B0P05DRAFT_583821 [Gilbertella persicaria]|uniref:Uncharacterized protein n=1 Tax=Rhizopus stolonifer TaxID=4846 RepID=A0A367KSH6_RHIST|nr:uncharacterized protein B0P05DRAFT_583821 [Gilbertella persicaria]KAI8091308.1 hypothetical protein B0P05DRAFT_583821 [Gilbertella persicaria]RCI05155.1 hypothetical protein CU098_013422 [Rhizopus stolonifer]
MPYSKDSSYNIARLKSAYNWYPVEELQKNVYELENIDFNKPNLRDSLRDKIKKISAGLSEKEQDALFDMEKRFPCDKAYVYLYASGYIKIFSELWGNLERFQSTQEKGEDIVSPFERTSPYLQPPPSFLYKSLMDLKMKIGDGEHVYNCTRFEEVFKVNWESGDSEQYTK